MKNWADHKNRTVTELSWAEVITEQVRSLRFGVVQIIVHDSKVVQIERTEKIRLSESTQPNQTAGA